MAKKRKIPKGRKLPPSGKYRIRYDREIVDSDYENNKRDAMSTIRQTLERHPHIKASLDIRGKGRYKYKPHSSYKYRKNRETGRMRLVKL